MELHEYPRPANDTGIGIHWSVGFASASGMGRIRDFWIPELKAMGVKWVKISNHDGAIDFAELLLAEGIMPIVRIFRPSPNPGVLDVRELVHLDALVRVGVRYFEFNNEPDKDSEWKGGRVPANGLDLVVEHTIANMETILERGGMPAAPALSNGCRWDLVGKIVARGRRDLFDGPVWQAIHNYSQNRPMDYPYDIGNQEGAAYTQRFYAAIASEKWQEDSWRGRALSEINQLRVDRSNPGATIMDDHACWLAYEYFDARNRRHIGHSIPILSTECGYLVGEDTDPRYPATSPDLHMAQTLESCRVMMGTSERFASAPDYYFCTAFWLLGNAALGNGSTWCEPHAWYSDRWPAKSLPIVPALKAEPKSVRRWMGMSEVGSRSTLRGAVRHAGDRRSLVLEKGGTEVAHTTVDAHSRYVIPDLLPGNYMLRVEGTGVAAEVRLLPGQEEAIVDLDLSQAGAEASASTVLGAVRGGAGAVVLLLRTSDGEEWVTMARDDGSFRFVDLPPGVYNVRVQDGGSRRDGISLDGIRQVEVELAAAGWGHTVRSSGRRASGGAVCVSVEGQPNLPVTAHSGEWTSEPMYTGSAPEFGPDACVIGPVEPGHYIIAVDGLRDEEGKPISLEAYVHVAGAEMPMVEFVFNRVEQADATRRSGIRGRVIGACGPGHELHVWLYDSQANRHSQVVRDDCTFAFEELPAGHYSVEIVGFADVASLSDIALDGENTVEVELYIPEAGEAEVKEISGQSAISGWAPNCAGKTARLVDAVGNEHKQKVSLEDSFYFDELDSGVYTLTVEGGYEQHQLEVDGRSGLHVEFQPLVSTWEANSSPAGSMPGYSVVRVEVEGMRGLPVYIWKDDWEGMMRRTGSKPEYGECAVEFSPLGPGTYMVEPEGLGIWADVELTGLEAVWLDFRRKSVPSSPNIVTELPGGFVDEAEDETDDSHTGFAPIAREPIVRESTPPPPAAYEPDAAEPGEFEPESYELEAPTSDADEFQPEAFVADDSEWEAFEPKVYEPEAGPASEFATGAEPDVVADFETSDESEEPRSGVAQPVSEPEASALESVEPAPVDLEPVESEATEPGEYEPEAFAAGMAATQAREPEATGSDTGGPDAAQGEPAKPEPDEPEIDEPEPEETGPSSLWLPSVSSAQDEPVESWPEEYAQYVRRHATLQPETRPQEAPQSETRQPESSEPEDEREVGAETRDALPDEGFADGASGDEKPARAMQGAGPERVCVLVLTQPGTIEAMRSLLSYVSEVGATIIADVDAAFTFDKVVVIGDPDDGRVEAALNRLRGWGIAPITDIRQLGRPSADKG